MPKKVKLTIEFDTQEQLEHFASWLCGQGEQNYWGWMEYREQEESNDITAIQFDYHAGEVDLNYPLDDERHYANEKFMGDNTIRTTCGRLDKKE